MSRSTRIALVIAGLAVAASAASAASTGDAGPVATPVQNRSATATAHKPVSTYSNWGSAAGLALVAGFNNLDTPTTVNCTNAAGCTILGNSFVQIAPPAGTFWALCMVVDGVYMNPGCPYQGTSANVGSYLSGNGLFNVQVSSGTHVVQAQVYVSQASTLGNWQANYGVYKP